MRFTITTHGYPHHVRVNPRLQRREQLRLQAEKAMRQARAAGKTITSPAAKPNYHQQPEAR